MTQHRNCLKCKHCSLSMGYPGWSEYTPGEHASWSCLKGRWPSAQADGELQDAMAELFSKAETCPDYTPEKRWENA